MAELDPEDSPHVHQALRDPQYSVRTDIPFTRILDHGNAPKAKYRRRKGEHKTVVHWGQRKLLMSEIEFLTKYAAEAKVVVYAGAAPGTHIQYLAEMFPSLHFVLVDPAPFTVKETDHIICRQQLFTDELAEQYKGTAENPCLFISDIRSADWQALEEDENEKEVQNNMNSQSEWHKIIKPVASLLKFRLPWTEGKTTYLDGQIYLPVYGPITTTESRLMVAGDASTREYDNKVYEQEMFWFNTVQRVALYPHLVRKDHPHDGIDNCFDCASEVHILRDYILQKSDETAPENLDEEIARLSRQISSRCAANRRLSDPNPDPEDRKARIVKRQYVDNQPAYLACKRQRTSENPVEYSKASRAMLTKHGFEEGQGLGKEGRKGNPNPLDPISNTGTRGLGFDVAKHRPWERDSSRKDEASSNWSSTTNSTTDTNSYSRDKDRDRNHDRYSERSRSERHRYDDRNNRSDERNSLDERSRSYAKYGRDGEQGDKREESNGRNETNKQKEDAGTGEKETHDAGGNGDSEKHVSEGNSALQRKSVLSRLGPSPFAN